MSPTLGKFSPVAAIALLVVWCSWPAETGAPPEVERPRTKERSRAAPTPQPDSTPIRDPFALQSGGTGKTVRNSKPAPAPITPTKPPPVLVQDAPPVTKLSSLTLGATFIRGERRVALINNQFYAEGEALKDSKGTKGKCMVEQVDVDRVVLRQGDEKMELKFRAPESKPSPRVAVAKPAR